MKRTYTIAGGLVLITLLTVITAQAQSTNQPLIANIPFEFSAGSQVMPSGKYAVTVANPSSDQRVIKLKALETGESVLLMMHSVKSGDEEKSSLVFNRYGNSYFLSRAWRSGDSAGMEAAKSKAEREVGKAFTKPVNETIALRNN